MTWKRVSRHCTEFEWPIGPAYTSVWAKQYAVVALHHQILAVAVTRIEEKWKAYVAPVAGINHDDEWKEVWQHGAQLPEDVAAALFPGFATLTYAR